MTTKYFTTAHWGSYYVYTDQGKIVDFSAVDEDRDPSDIMKNMLHVMDDDSRITAPMVRESYLLHGYANQEKHKGKRGKEKFIEVTWDEAEELVAEELRRVIEQNGNQAIFAGSYGWASAGRFHHAQSQLKRFLNGLGGFTRSVDTYSFAAAEVILPHVIGNLYDVIQATTSWKTIAENCEHFICFGGLRLSNAQVNNGGLLAHTQKDGMYDAYQKGVKFINISPVADDTDHRIHPRWFSIRPNTDAALMLALCHYLIDQNHHDQLFLSTYCHGFEKIVPYLFGEKDGVEKNVSWAAHITGLHEDSIMELANIMAKKKCMISLGWSLTRQEYGEYIYWSGILLAAIIGKIGTKEGGIGFGYSGVNGVGHHYKRIKTASLEQGCNRVKDFIPVARIADMLLHPGEKFTYNGKNYIYPDIKLIYWAGGNPFHHHQDLLKLQKAWQRPDTIIAHEWCWNSHAQHADIILPCTTFLERNDIAASARDGFIHFMEKAIEPVGKSKNDHDIFASLAKKLGIYDTFTCHKNEDAWLKTIYDRSCENLQDISPAMPSYEEFKKQKRFLADCDQHDIFLQDFRDDPQENPLPTPSGKIELFSDVIDSFSNPKTPPHAFWHEPSEWLGASHKSHVFHLLTCQPKNKLHSQLEHGSYCQSSKIHGHEVITMNDEDAREYQCKDGDIIKVYNERGGFLCAVKTSRFIHKKVLHIATGAWLHLIEDRDGFVICKNGNPNMVTQDKGTSALAQGPSSNTCLVSIALV